MDEVSRETSNKKIRGGWHRIIMPAYSEKYSEKLTCVTLGHEEFYLMCRALDFHL